MRFIASTFRSWAPSVGFLLALILSAMTGQATHAASEGGLPQLDTSSFASQIFWLVVCFACFYLVLARIAMPRISETLERRALEISRDLERADKLNEEARRIAASIDEQMDAAQAQAQEVMLAANEKAKEMIRQRLEALDLELAGQVSELERALTEARQNALQQLETHGTDLAQQIVTRLVSHQGDAKLIGDAVRAANAGHQARHQATS